MRLVIQRVSRASVKVDAKTVGSIKKGLLILVGIGENDNEETVKSLAEKVVKLRVMADENKKMNLSVKQVGGEILAVSQFTLFADTSKGNRPSFIKAADPEKANKLYEYFVRKLVEAGVKVETGEFGEYMDIESSLDGPVTIIL
jgi:D-tyrosyl-tRNA(Tyr) deacylase